MRSKGRNKSALFRGHGNYGGRVALLGNGAISHKLQEFLGHHALDVAVVPSRKERRTLSLEDAFSSSFAVVNLFPDRDDNAGVLNASLFERMIENAVFINVGRGRQVDEAGLIGVLKQRPDLTALLDVQWPEPPEEDSDLYPLPNVRLSNHIAGSTGTELHRMADFMIEDFERYARGEPLEHEVRPDQL
jgi:phosphoglycerate dehydrogenase-like enzyme